MGDAPEGATVQAVPGLAAGRLQTASAGRPSRTAERRIGTSGGEPERYRRLGEGEALSGNGRPRAVEVSGVSPNHREPLQ